MIQQVRQVQYFQSNQEIQEDLMLREDPGNRTSRYFQLDQRLLEVQMLRTDLEIQSVLSTRCFQVVQELQQHQSFRHFRRNQQDPFLQPAPLHLEGPVVRQVRQVPQVLYFLFLPLHQAVPMVQEDQEVPEDQVVRVVQFLQLHPEVLVDPEDL